LLTANLGEILSGLSTGISKKEIEGHIFRENR